jgi:hypothetical protein
MLNLQTSIKHQSVKSYNTVLLEKNRRKRVLEGMTWLIVNKVQQREFRMSWYKLQQHESSDFGFIPTKGNDWVPEAGSSEESMVQNGFSLENFKLLDEMHFLNKKIEEMKPVIDRYDALVRRDEISNIVTENFKKIDSPRRHV